LFLNCFEIDGTHAFWATIQMLKNGACGGPLLKIHSCFCSQQGPGFWRQKKESKNTLKK